MPASHFIFALFSSAKFSCHDDVRLGLVRFGIYPAIQATLVYGWIMYPARFKIRAGSLYSNCTLSASTSSTDSSVAAIIVSIGSCCSRSFRAIFRRSSIFPFNSPSLSLPSVPFQTHSIWSVRHCPYCKVPSVPSPFRVRGTSFPLVSVRILSAVVTNNRQNEE